MLSITELKAEFENYIQTEHFKGNPQSLYDPVNYILSIGGKRLRPSLLISAYQLYQEDIVSALPAAMAIELFHNFTLLHDDIMDEAPLRRGEPTVHEKYNQSAAILSGDVMLIYAYKYLGQSAHEDLGQLYKIFTDTSILICEGQQMDMDFEVRDDVSIQEYIQMIEGKTAVLLGAALQIGALIGGASDQDAHHLYQFGKNIGIAFQIQDDVLDVYGNPETFGKQVGGDILQGKKTYLYLKTLELLGDKEAPAFDKVYNGNSADKIEKTKQYFRDVNIKGYSAELQQVYYELAMSHLDALSIDIPDEHTVKQLAPKAVERIA